MTKIWCPICQGYTCDPWNHLNDGGYTTEHIRLVGTIWRDLYNTLTGTTENTGTQPYPPTVSCRGVFFWGNHRDLILDGTKYGMMEHRNQLMLAQALIRPSSKLWNQQVFSFESLITVASTAQARITVKNLYDSRVFGGTGTISHVQSMDQPFGIPTAPQDWDRLQLLYIPLVAIGWARKTGWERMRAEWIHAVEGRISRPILLRVVPPKTNCMGHMPG